MTNLYPTASTIAVFLNGQHIDQAYQLQYRETINKVPIYGYNDYKYSKVAQSKQLIEGILVINFIFPGYLNSVIDSQYLDLGSFVPSLYNYSFSDKGITSKNKLIDSISKELKTELPPNEDAATRSARASYIASLLSKDKNTREATKKALERQFVEPEAKTTKELESPLVVPSDGAILDIYYQDPTYSTWFTRFTKVHFYQVSQANSQAGAEGSSDPLYEIYSFISNERKTRLIGEIS